MPILRITKRAVDALEPSGRRVYYYDKDAKGFGVVVTPAGAKSYFAEWRAGTGRSAPTKRMAIGSVGTLTPDEARSAATNIIARARLARSGMGEDPALARSRERETLTVAALADRFINEHLETKRKASTAAWARDILERLVMPKLGTLKADKVAEADIGKLHRELKKTPYQANRMLAILGSMFGWAGRQNLVPRGYNPATSVERFPETARERFLSTAELVRIGEAIREAETVGLPWQIDREAAGAKHLPKNAETKRTKIHPHAAAALRLLLLTGARLREILNLRWEHVDLERGLLLLPDSKTGRKTIVLNAPAMAILAGLERISEYVIAGADPAKPRADLKRARTVVWKRAGIEGVRLHDLRHSFASFGAGSGLGLPIIGKLLGHADVKTTARYAHLDADPVRRATDAIGHQIAAALDGQQAGGTVVPLKRTGGQ